jgi:hypothetical protein
MAPLALVWLGSGHRELSSRVVWSHRGDNLEITRNGSISPCCLVIGEIDPACLWSRNSIAPGTVSPAVCGDYRESCARAPGRRPLGRA